MTDDAQILQYETPPPDVVKPPAPFYLRMLLTILLAALALFLGYIYCFTPLGHQLRDRHAVHEWVSVHPNITPLILVGLYIVFGICMLPVWWIQISAGYCFGLWWGLLYCEIGAVIAAMLSINLSRWLLEEWFRRRYECKIAKLHELNKTLGHNGLLVVMTVRLAHVMPFGVSNYLFGLTRITTLDISIGTLFGGSVAISFYVAIGVGGHILRDWRYWTGIGIVNLVLLIPLILRYMFPESFKRMGVE